MQLTRWNAFPSLFNQLQQFQTEMNRLLDRWGTDGGSLLRGIAPAYPAVNIWEDEEFVFVEAELPGLNLDDLEIYVTGGNQLTIKGERKAPEVGKGVWHRQERGQGSFVRVLNLPFAVDADKVDAQFANGVLLVKLAKHEQAKPRKIPVKSE